MKYKTLTIVAIIVTILLLWIIISAFFSEVPFYKPINMDLNKNGFAIYNNILTNEEIHKFVEFNT
jgi:hypothetical protein